MQLRSHPPFRQGNGRAQPVGFELSVGAMRKAFAALRFQNAQSIFRGELQQNSCKLSLGGPREKRKVLSTMCCFLYNSPGRQVFAREASDSFLFVQEGEDLLHAGIGINLLHIRFLCLLYQPDGSGF